MFKTSRNRNSVKNILDFTGFLRFLGNNSVIPFLTVAEKRHFYPPKLPALRAEVDGLAQKSVRPFSCFLAAAPKIPRFYPFRRFPRLPQAAFPTAVLANTSIFRQRSRTSAQRPVFWCLTGTRSAVPQKPHKPPTRVRRRGNLCLQRRRLCVFLVHAKTRTYNFAAYRGCSDGRRRVYIRGVPYAFFSL